MKREVVIQRQISVSEFIPESQRSDFFVTLSRYCFDMHKRNEALDYIQHGVGAGHSDELFNSKLKEFVNCSPQNPERFLRFAPKCGRELALLLSVSTSLVLQMGRKYLRWLVMKNQHWFCYWLISCRNLTTYIF